MYSHIISPIFRDIVLILITNNILIENHIVDVLLYPKDIVVVEVLLYSC